jgi:predicted DNA-binding transcriptional regulator AlpA
MEKLLTAIQVADHLGMHPKTLYKLLRENRISLNFIRLTGKMIAFRPKDVETYLSLHEVIRTGDGPKKKNKAITKPKFKYQIMTDIQAQEFFDGIRVISDDYPEPDDSEEGSLYIYKP